MCLFNVPIKIHGCQIIENTETRAMLKTTHLKPGVNTLKNIKTCYSTNSKLLGKNRSSIKGQDEFRDGIPQKQKSYHSISSSYRLFTEERLNVRCSARMSYQTITVPCKHK